MSLLQSPKQDELVHLSTMLLQLESYQKQACLKLVWISEHYKAVIYVAAVQTCLQVYECFVRVEQSRSESPQPTISLLCHISVVIAQFMCFWNSVWAIALLLAVVKLRGLILKCLAAETPCLALISTVTFNHLSSQQGWKIFQALETFHVRTNS